ncbi:MAG: NTP transferase domain-containing protein [Acidobacteriota bacterium]|nr:NTP transferase domain-containing protein [Acidobacteriota bacterium]
MTSVVVPFAGSAGKTRLDTSARTRRELALARLADVLAAATVVGRTVVVTPDAEGIDLMGADVLDDPGGGQGAAVTAALARLDGAVLVVNADVPCVTPFDLRALLDATPPRGLALVEALDGTTNALGLSTPAVFEPLYGPDSARRFLALPVETVSVAIPNIADDVDTQADIDRLQLRCGPRTQSILAGTAP